MTKEQIDKLRVGDVIRVEYAVAAEDISSFTLVSSNGTRHRATRTGHNPILDAAHLVVPEQAVATPPAFEVGDTVRIVTDPLTGHVHVACGGFNNSIIGLEGTVEAIHRDTCKAYIRAKSDVGCCTRRGVSLHCLELVKKAVKDKYAVRKCYAGGACTYCKIVALGNEEAVALFCCSLHPDAKAAAEAECARLNAEWRKKQKGGAG